MNITDKVTTLARYIEKAATGRITDLRVTAGPGGRDNGAYLGLQWHDADPTVTPVKVAMVVGIALAEYRIEAAESLTGIDQAIDLALDAIDVARSAGCLLIQFTDPDKE